MPEPVEGAAAAAEVIVAAPEPAPAAAAEEGAGAEANPLRNLFHAAFVASDYPETGDQRGGVRPRPCSSALRVAHPLAHSHHPSPRAARPRPDPQTAEVEEEEEFEQVRPDPSIPMYVNPFGTSTQERYGKNWSPEEGASTTALPRVRDAGDPYDPPTPLYLSRWQSARSSTRTASTARTGALSSPCCPSARASSRNGSASSRRVRCVHGLALTKVYSCI